jgi:hypothetical protein
MAHADSVRVNQALRQELLALLEQDHAFSKAPQQDPNSDQVQRQRLQLLDRHRRRLVEILDTHGWPGRSLVGDDGAEAAWMLALHTMPDPQVLRRCLRLLETAAAVGEAPSWQVAFLVDRVSLVERNVQVYGTTICRQADGSFGAPLLEDPDQVDARRRAVGLPPLAEDLRKLEAFYRRENELHQADAIAARATTQDLPHSGEGGKR